MTLPTPDSPSAMSVRCSLRSSSTTTSSRQQSEAVDATWVMPVQMPRREWAVACPPSGSRSEIHGGCQCSRELMLLMDDLDSKSEAAHAQKLDALLAYQRRAFRTCAKLLDCSFCNSAPDYMMLLAVVCRKLILHMEAILDAFMAQEKHNSSGSGERLIPWRILLGEYPVETELEWMTIMASMIAIQLNAALKVLERLKCTAQNTLRDTQTTILRSTEQKARKMLSDLRIFRNQKPRPG